MSNLSFIQENSSNFVKIARGLRRKIPEKLSNIVQMLETSAVEYKTENLGTIRYRTLERLYEERGLDRIRKKWQRQKEEAKICRQPKIKEDISGLFVKLTQEEMIVLCLFFSIEPPKCVEDPSLIIKGLNKPHKLKAKDVSEITGLPVNRCYYIKRRAIQKIKNVGRRFYRSTTHN